jgi:hypothetical protein
VWHQNRTAPSAENCVWTLGNVTIHNNVITMPLGVTGLFTWNVTDGDTVFYDGRAKFYGNTYHVPSLIGRYWQWMNTTQTIPGWQSYDNDVTGSFNPL